VSIHCPVARTRNRHFREGGPRFPLIVNKCADVGENRKCSKKIVALTVQKLDIDGACHSKKTLKLDSPARIITLKKESFPNVEQEAQTLETEFGPFFHLSFFTDQNSRKLRVPSSEGEPLSVPP
jgi:hypothetical protein